MGTKNWSLDDLNGLFKQHYGKLVEDVLVKTAPYLDTNYLKKNLDRIELDKDHGYVVYIKGINGSINESQLNDESRAYIKQVHSQYQSPLWKVLNGEPIE